MKVYKYMLLSLETPIRISADATVLSTGTQLDEAGTERIFVWVLTDPKKDHKRDAMIEIVPTGVTTHRTKKEFIGTVQMKDGLVFHIFERGRQ